jgi:hypothetical protein
MAAAPLLAGCGLFGGSKALRQDAPQEMTVTSPVFSQETSPPVHRHGRGDSPPIYWSGAPRERRRWRLSLMTLMLPSRLTFTGSCWI